MSRSAMSRATSRAGGPTGAQGRSPASGRPAAPAGPRIPRVAGVVLAGGMSRRFGSDKLAAPFGGETLLAASVRAVAAVTDEVVVAIRPIGDEPPLPDDLPVPVRWVRDAEEGGGPLAALPGALDATSAPIVLVVAGDAPHLPPGIARVLLEALAEAGPARPGLTVGGDRGRATAAALLEAGAFQPLPLALRREAAGRAAVRLLAQGERRLRALLVVLAATAVPEATWRREDPDGLVLRDVDVPEDLAEDEDPR